MSNLKRLRLNKGLSQIDLSKLSGVKQNYISEIENGTKTGSVKTLSNIAKALGVPLSDIVEDHR